LPELAVDGLPRSAARELLRSVLPGRLDVRVADQIVAETRGNPLALLELPRGLSRAQLAAGFGWVGASSLSGRIEESFRQRLEVLTEDTQAFLLLAAAEPTGDPALLRRAVERLGIAGPALELAESAGLIEIDGRVRFRHPLARSAVYGAAGTDQRRRAHEALAEVTDAQTDPDRRAWHLAEATAGLDEDVAAELEHAAGRAQERGGLAAAAAFLERAAALTPEPRRRAQRSLAAAQTEYEAGALDDALALLRIAETGAADGVQRARVKLLRAQVAFASRRGSDAPPLLLDAARDLEAIDPTLARATYLEALSAAMFAGRLARGADVVEVSEAALAGPPPPQPPAPSDLLLEGLAVRFTDGYAAGVPILKRALRAFGRETALPPEEARWLWFASWIALYLWDDHAWTVLSTRHLDLVRETGALAALPFVLTNRSSVYAFFGQLGEAAACEEELRAATEATGIATVPYGALSLAALRGHEAELTELIRTSVSEAQSRGEGLVLTVTEFLSGIFYNGLGRYEEALAAVGDAGCYPEEGPAIWALTELIEAAVRCDQPQLASRALERVADTARASGTDWALGVEARCRALLSEGDTAESLYREGIERLGRTSIRVDLARAHPTTESGCGVSGAAAGPGNSCAPRSSCSVRWTSRRSPPARSASCWPPASGSANAASRPAMSSLPRRLRLRASPATVSRTPTSASGCSSASTRSPTTCARCSRSSTSPRGTRSTGYRPSTRRRARCAAGRPMTARRVTRRGRLTRVLIGRILVNAPEGRPSSPPRHP
jgi:tetratricopeptide (TPR) repeat protein